MNWLKAMVKVHGEATYQLTSTYVQCGGHLLTLILQIIARKYSKISTTMKRGILSWSKHVGYIVLSYQPENVGINTLTFLL